MQKNKSTEEELSLDTDLVPDNWDELPDLEVYDDEDLSFVKHHGQSQATEEADELVLDELDEYLNDDLLADLHADTEEDELQLSSDDEQLINDDLLIDEDELLQDKLTAEQLTVELDQLEISDEAELNDLDDDSIELELDIDELTSDDMELDGIELDEIELTGHDDSTTENSAQELELSDLDLELPDDETEDLIDLSENESQANAESTIDKLAQHQNTLSSDDDSTSDLDLQTSSQPLINSIDSLAVQLNQLTQAVSELLQQKNQVESEPINVQKLFSTGVYYAKHADYIHAAKWFRRAAMASHGKAMFYLGMMFIKGEGLPKSIIHSYVWMSLANVYGVSEAKAAMMDIQHRLTAHELNQAQRLAAEKYEEIENIQAKIALHISPTDSQK